MEHSRNFPTSTHYFPDLIKHNAVYVDKTQFIVPLLQKEYNSNYFLSRPRRFGKSLFVSTLEQVFLGKKELFKGLYIEDKIDWAVFPVVRISMDKIGFPELGLEQALKNTVHKIALTHDLTLTEEKSAGLSLEELIIKLFEKYKKQVVILIDEYDKPVVQYIEKEDTAQALINRDILKSFYGVLKDSGYYLRFVFITGITKFAKVSIFSDLNYFTDLTFHNRYTCICGFTEAEIRQYCYGGLEDLAAKENKDITAVIDKIRNWYNGFSWDAINFVYNPYSTMQLMDSLAFENYWFESGTPSFLVKIINKVNRYNFDNIKVEKDDFNWHDLAHLDYISIMLQTGYLTLKESVGDNFYKASYPNKEVERAFERMLLKGYMYDKPSQMSETILDIQEAIEKHDLERVIEILKHMFSVLPSHFFKESKETIDKQGNIKMVSNAVGESFYHAIIYLIFNILGVRMQVEVTTQKGRIDAVVETDNYIYIFEFKVNRKSNAAIDQIINNNYAQQFALSKKTIYLIGVGFNLRKKGISDYTITPFHK
jgi:Predicted AAA-ATPase/PD-(D/E)XK nuclease superfamily